MVRCAYGGGELRPPVRYAPARLSRISAVSAVVCNYDGESYLPACLESVLAQGVDEVIVVDDASRDGSAARVRARFPAVRLIENAENRGFAAANNQAFLETRGRYVLMLNPDTVVSTWRSLAEQAPPPVQDARRSVAR